MQYSHEVEEMVCVKKGPKGAVEYVEDETKTTVDKSQWKGIAVFADCADGGIHPVSFELIGKAKELAAEIGHPVYAVLMVRCAYQRL